MALLLCLTTSLHAAIPEDLSQTIDAELTSPFTLKLKNGQRIEGNVIDVSEKQIQIASAEGAGEIIFTFQAEEIKEILIPGDSFKNLAIEWMNAGETENTLELMSRLYLQRSPLLSLLPASESHFFILYAELILESPKPARAIAVAETLRPQIENPAALRALSDAILKSYQTLELYEQALPLAESWIAERNPYGESALGYYVLGAAMIRSEAYEAALDLALQPVVFSSPIPTDQLAECYAVAISAALGLREREYALTLYREMQERGFQWPSKERTLEPFYKEITEYIETHENPTEPVS